MKKPPKKMKMFVWYPKSLTDYTSGIVCVIAESKDAAIKLAVDQRYPNYLRRQRVSVRFVEQNNLDRLAFADELKQDTPVIIHRGCVYEYGGS
jgi:hypothetical protein